MKLPLGQTVITRGALAALDHQEVRDALVRHSSGDWGEVCNEDRLANDQAVVHGSRILSAYRTGKRVKFWIITEWDRSVTTILLPDEY